jgi:hypothetical protein
MIPIAITAATCHAIAETLPQGGTLYEAHRNGNCVLPFL